MSESNSNTEVLKTAMESEKADFEQQMQTLRALNSELNSRVEKSEQDKLTLSSTITVSPVPLLVSCSCNYLVTKMQMILICDKVLLINDLG